MSANGRNKIKCTRYKAEHRREKNLLKKFLKLLKRQPNNLQIPKAIEKLK